MKNTYYIISIVLLFMFSSCEQINKKEVDKKPEPQAEELIQNLKIGDLEILEIDNCEYIIYKKSPNRNKGFGFMSHKGNCKNPIHYHNRK